MENCIFCKIASGVIPSYKIWEDKDFFAFLDMNPVNPGHTLVIPKSHTDYFFDLDDITYTQILLAAKKLSFPIQKALQAKRIGVSVEGFGVAHAHVHLIPINNAHELDPDKASKASPEELEKVQKNILQYIE